MRYTVYDLIIDVKRKIHGATPENIQYALDEGRRNMISKIRPPEMARKAYIEDALFPKVDKYAIPEDVKYSDVIDINLLSSHHNLDTVYRPLAQVYRRQFDQKNRSNVFAINWQNGVKTMSIFRPRGLDFCSYLKINDFDSLTKNGTWNVGGNVENLKLDELNHISRRASLSFDINSSSATGFIENFTMDEVDIEDYLNKGAIFQWLSVPNCLPLTSVKVKLGSNLSDLTTDYYYATVNQAHDNNEFVPNWNLLKYMGQSLETVGTPNPKSIKFIRVEFTTTGAAISRCNIDAMVMRKGKVYEMNYNSAYCLIDPVSRAWKMKTTRNGDMIVAEEDTYQILMLETALTTQKNIYANNAGAHADVTDITNELKGKYEDYKREHKGEFIEPEQYTDVMGRMHYGYGYNDDGYRHCSRPNGWFEDGNNNCDAGNNC